MPPVSFLAFIALLFAACALVVNFPWLAILTLYGACRVAEDAPPDCETGFLGVLGIAAALGVVLFAAMA